MRIVCSVLLLTQVFTFQTPQTVSDASPVEVLKFSRERSRIEHPGAQNAALPPSASSRPGSKTTEEQSAELRSVEIESMRDNVIRPIEGYLLKVKLKNGDTKLIRAIYWEHRSPGAKPAEVVGRQFFCKVKLKAGGITDLEAFSPSIFSGVIDAKTLERDSPFPNETVVVNRIEYSDRTIWQRSGWRLLKPETISESPQPEWAKLRGCVDLSPFIRH